MENVQYSSRLHVKHERILLSEKILNSFLTSRKIAEHF